MYGEPKYLPVEPRVEQNWVYLYSSPPYPMPAVDYFTSRLYWDLPYTADDVKISIYDIYGNKQLQAQVVVEPMSEYSGILRVDCRSLANGVYTAVLRLATKTLSIPFIVSR